MSFLAILSILSPFLDELVGDSRQEVAFFFRLRTTCIKVTDDILIPIRVDPQCDLSYFVMLAERRRKKCIYYVIKKRENFVGSYDQRYSMTLNYARQRFTFVVDSSLESSSSSSSSNRVLPIPKSKFRPAIQKLTLTVYNNIVVYEVEVLNSATVEHVKTMIQTKSHISADRMTLYFESPSRLVELDDIKLLSDYSIMNGDSLVLFTRKAEWEDNSGDEGSAQKMLEDLEKKDDTPWGRIRRLLDQMGEDEDSQKLVELRRNYENARMTYRKSRDAAVKALKAFREFDQQCSEKYGRSWGPYGTQTTR